MRNTIILLLISLIYVLDSKVYNNYHVLSTSRKTDFGQCRFQRESTKSDDQCAMPQEDNYVRQNVDLTFDDVREACPALQYTSCTSMDQLVWPVYKGQTTYDCACPKCKCGDKNIRTEYSIQTTLDVPAPNTAARPYVACIKCDCLYDTDYAEEVESCSEQSKDFGYLTGQFVCPKTNEPTISPTTVIGKLGCELYGKKYAAGDSFFTNYTTESSITSMTCQQFCVCDPKGSGNLTCSTGATTVDHYKSMYSTEILYYNLIEQCREVIGDCVTEVTGYENLFTWNRTNTHLYCNTNPNVGTELCPRCRCDGTAPRSLTGHFPTTIVPAGGVKVDKYNISNSYIEYSCTNCTCEDITLQHQPVNGYMTTARCPKYRNTGINYKDPSECAYPIWNCMSGTANTVTKLPTSTTTCPIVNNNQRFCWSFGVDYVTQPSVVCDSPETEGEYNCQRDALCEAFNLYRASPVTIPGPGAQVVNYCFDQNVTYTAATYDCDTEKYLTEDVVVRVRARCCLGDYCNNRTISDVSTCVGTSGDPGIGGNNEAISAYFGGKFKAEKGIEFNSFEDSEFGQFLHCEQPLRLRNYWNKEVSGSTCSYLARWFQYLNKDDCNTLTPVIELLKKRSDTPPALAVLESALNTTLFNSFENNLKRYNDYYGCGLKYTCNPSNAIIVSLSKYVIAIIAVIMLAIH